VRQVHAHARADARTRGAAAAAREAAREAAARRQRRVRTAAHHVRSGSALGARAHSPAGPGWPVREEVGGRQPACAAWDVNHARVRSRLGARSAHRHPGVRTSTCRSHPRRSNLTMTRAPMAPAAPPCARVRSGLGRAAPRLAREERIGGWSESSGSGKAACARESTSRKRVGGRAARARGLA